MVLNATRLPRSRCTASYTMAIPPLPSGRTISYRPNTAPGGRTDALMDGPRTVHLCVLAVYDRAPPGTRTVRLQPRVRVRVRVRARARASAPASSGRLPRRTQRGHDARSMKPARLLLVALAAVAVAGVCAVLLHDRGTR